MPTERSPRFAIVDVMLVVPGPRSGSAHDVLGRLYCDSASAFNDPVLRLTDA